MVPLIGDRIPKYNIISMGEMARIGEWVEVFRALIALGILGYVAVTISSVIPIGPFLQILPLFYFAITVAIVIGVLEVPDHGTLFTIGWTFASLLLAGSGLISRWEALLDLVPIALIIWNYLDDSGGLNGTYL